MVVKRKSKSKDKKVKAKVTSIPVAKPELKRVEPDEWYKASFEEAEIKEGLYGDYLQLNFKLRSGYLEDSEQPAKGLPQVAFINLPINPESDNAILIKNLTGKAVEDGEQVDLTPHYGSVYKVFVTDKVSKKDKTVRQSIFKVKKITKKT